MYLTAANPRSTVLYSKLATLELCGWIEMSMDDIVERLGRKKLRDPAHLAQVQNVIRRTYGFKYEQHFRGMLQAVIGLHGVAAMERRVDPALFLPLCATLNALKPDRDEAAHQYIKGTTPNFDAPSATLAKFNTVYLGLVEVDRVLRRL